MEAIQQSLFPDIVPHEKSRKQNLPVVGTQPDREMAFSFGYNWLGWFGCLLMGSFDARVCPTGFRLVAISFRWNAYRPWIRLEAHDSSGESLVCFVSDLNRSKVVRSLRYLARRGQLTWKPDKFKGKVARKP